MSVQRGGGGVSDYRDVDRQDRYFHYSVDAGALTGGTGQGGGDYNKLEDAESVGVMGNLRPTEEAQILAFKAEIVAWVNSTETADGTFEGRAYISLKGNNPMIERNGTGVSSTNINSTDWDRVDVGGSLDNRILTVHTMVGTGPFSDGASGVGGGGSAMKSRDEVDFIDQFGSGPIVDSSQDDIYLHVEGRTWNIDDAAVHIGGHWTAFYDVYPVHE